MVIGDEEIRRAMQSDRFRFRQQWRALIEAEKKGRSVEPRWQRLHDELAASIALRQSRQDGIPPIRFDDELPISARRVEIAQAIQENQVVIVCGETGSGKSTQLPKICLEMGRGIEAMIGHTQPRRIAARSVAARVAEELGTPLGQHCGFKVRFAQAMSSQTSIKLMTDGILLAETQADRFLDQYDTIILDEAHERSLNIDFLIGYLKRLLPRRRDLKLIITSATIDAARFSTHFATAAGPAPVVEVSGRTYPVEIRYRPLGGEEGESEPDLQDSVLAAVEEVARIDRGDILIFMPTERDIHETAKTLRSHPLPGDATGRDTEILPLYARLSIQEQQRVFQPGPKRRIVIATNVAESSLTVPRVHYVIDPGTARISRYSPRTKTQRLPIEPVSQASLDQRMGRCGRVGPGICLRLFEEKEYALRDRYTAPEIQRTNLASVILQTKALRLGKIEDFPFLDPPRPDAIRDGYRTLFELGATDEDGELTELGNRLARLPVDPRIGRMILAAAEGACLAEVLVIASALELQDPRERPLEKQEAADAMHVQFIDRESDFLSYLRLWDFYHGLKSRLSRNQLQKACRQNFLSFNRVREWTDIHRELLELVQRSGMKVHPRVAAARGIGTRAGGRGTGPFSSNKNWDSPSSNANRDDSSQAPVKYPEFGDEKYSAIHRAVLAGLLANVAQRREGFEYSTAGGGKAHLWPGSGAFQGKPRWIMAAEVVETTRRYLRTCGRIKPRWIEQIAPHLVKRTYHDLRWDAERGTAIAMERITLFGLVIADNRPIRYGPIDPAAARHLLIEEGLVEGKMAEKPDFLRQNEKLWEEMERLQHKIRRRDLLVGQWAFYEFYDRRIPAEVYDRATLMGWLNAAKSVPSRLLVMQREDMLRPEAGAVPTTGFPDALPLDSLELPLDYHYEPGSPDDGLTLRVPIAVLNQVNAEALGWLVPGLLEEKVLALIRALPKALRTRFVPAPETARRVAADLQFGQGDVRAAVATALTRIAGVPITVAAFDESRLPLELQMNVRVDGNDGRPVAAGRDLEAIRRELGSQAAASFSEIRDPRWTRDGMRDWDFQDLPTEIEFARAGLAVKGYPALVDQGDAVGLRLMDAADRATYFTRFGLRRLVILVAKSHLKLQVDWLPSLDRMRSQAAGLPGFDLEGQLIELLADRAFLADLPLPRSRGEYDACLAAGHDRLGLAIQEVAAVIEPLMAAYEETRRALEKVEGRGAAASAGGGGWQTLSHKADWRAVQQFRQAQHSDAPWQYARTDLQEQIAGLMTPEFLSTTPWRWLQQYPRFFRAIRFRLEALTAGGVARDRQAFEQFTPHLALYAERAARHAAAGLVDPELIHYRWMLEEYRVSLFAQKLGTSIPVSPRRLEQQWAKVRE